jgi:hypothetical protein
MALRHLLVNGNRQFPIIGSDSEHASALGTLGEARIPELVVAAAQQMLAAAAGPACVVAFRFRFGGGAVRKANGNLLGP